MRIIIICSLFLMGCAEQSEVGPCCEAKPLFSEWSSDTLALDLREAQVDVPRLVSVVDNGVPCEALVLMQSSLDDLTSGNLLFLSGCDDLNGADFKYSLWNNQLHLSSGEVLK